jgi:hypothetical protein
MRVLLWFLGLETSWMFSLYSVTFICHSTNDEWIMLCRWQITIGFVAELCVKTSFSFEVETHLIRNKKWHDFWKELLQQHLQKQLSRMFPREINWQCMIDPTVILYYFVAFLCNCSVNLISVWHPCMASIIYDWVANVTHCVVKF